MWWGQGAVFFMFDQMLEVEGGCVVELGSFLQSTSISKYCEYPIVEKQ